jgi:ketosteroid isomerase-like protein
MYVGKKECHPMETNSSTVRGEVLLASQQWIANFNKGDVDACLAAYLPDATIEAKPMGTFTGTQEIDDFWRPFMSSGATDLEYQEVTLDVINESTVHLSAKWQMNVGQGVITLEKWVNQSHGQWLLAHDAFEVLEQYPLES